IFTSPCCPSRDLLASPTRRSSDLWARRCGSGRASSSCKTRRRGRTGDEDLGWRVQIERADDESGHLTWPQLPVDATSQRHPVSRSEEHTSELQSRFDLVCRLLLEK